MPRGTTRKYDPDGFPVQQFSGPVIASIRNRLSEMGDVAPRTSYPVTQGSEAGVQQMRVCPDTRSTVRPVASEVNQRTLGLRIEDLRGREVVAVAGGPEKTSAILATLASGIITGLIIDEATARLVLAAADRPAARQPRGNARQRPSPSTG